MFPRARIRTNSIRLAARQHVQAARRTLVAAPRPGQGPLMERRADRALPSIATQNRWLRTMPIFLVVVTASALALFNYQKQSSSVVTSTLYALRTNEDARRILGDEIYFAHQIPWIWGEINQLHGRINIEFWVKGTRGKGLMKFRSERRKRMGFFDTMEWSLKTEDGEVISLLQSQQKVPFQQETADKIAVAV